MARSILTVRALALGGAMFCLTCASSQPTVSAQYPRRGPGCDIAVYQTSVPGVLAWDDLGIAEVACHVNLSPSQCMQNLKAEACRLGGDLLYNVPRNPLRPQDQVLLYRGQVAHTRSRGADKRDRHREDEEAGDAAAASNPGAPQVEDEAPPPASPEESAQPVVPLTGPAAPKAP